MAILLVVLYHAGVPGLHAGYVGVDVFFVVSGYLITSLLLREMDETHTIALSAFYARRARRLLPALVVMMLVTGLVAARVYPPIEQIELAPTFKWTSVYVGNLYFARAAVDYRGGDAAANPLLHTWSLAVEEQFYFAWPLALLISVGLLRIRQSSVRLAILALLAATSFCLSWYLTWTRQPWAFFLSPPRAWEFALGAAGSVVAPDGRLRLGPVRADGLARRLALGALGWLGLAAIIAGAVIIGRTTAFPGWVAIVPTLGTILVLVVGASPSAAAVGRFLETAPLQEIGRLSYSWYLWQWPTLVLTAAVGFQSSLTTRVGVAAGSLLLAKISYHLVEKPIRNSRGLVNRKPVYSLFLAAVLTVTAVGCTALWKRHAIRAARSPEQQAYIAVRTDRSALDAREDCNTFFHSSAVVDCIFGSTSPTATVVLLGDSHSSQWFPAVETIALRRHWRLVVLTKSACPVLETPVLLERLQREFSECTDWFQAALDRIAVLRPLVVIASSFSRYLSSRSMNPLNAQELFNGTSRAFGALSRASGGVVLLRDTPYPGLDVPLCLARQAWRSQPDTSCSFATESLRASEIYRIQQRAIADYSNVAAVDLTAAICPTARCQTERGGMIVFRDRSHLSRAFAATLAPALDAEIDRSLTSHLDGR